MKSKLGAVLLFLSVFGIGSAEAAYLRFQNSNGVNTPISQFNMYVSGANTNSTLTIGFNDITNVGFRFGLDASLGAQLLLDGNQVFQTSANLWWKRDWNNATVITQFFPTLSSGPHVLQLLWGEVCCGGPNSAEFTMDGGTTWQTLSKANLDAAAVPVPAAVWLFGSALAGLFGFRRKMDTTAVAA